MIVPTPGAEGVSVAPVKAAADAPGHWNPDSRQGLGPGPPVRRAYSDYCVSPANLPALNCMLPAPILRLDSYGNIRNVQLALP